MNDNKETIWQEWLGKADQDFRSLEALLKHREGSPSTGCFLAQQAIEKLLKAVLVFHDLELEKVHDLVTLANKVKRYEPEVSKFSKDLLNLTRYYIQTRYPGDYPELTWDDCQKAYDIAKDLKEFVINKLEKPLD